MPDGSVARIERTAAVARAHRVIKSGEFMDDVLDELFGAWTFEAAEVGFLPCQEVHRPRMQGTAGKAEDPVAAWDYDDGPAPDSPRGRPGESPAGSDDDPPAEGAQPRSRDVEAPPPAASLRDKVAGLLGRRD
jgi:hypothetical protein